MKSIGSPPGANNFRLLLIVILVAALWMFFLDYTDGISVETENASIQQTKNIINSSLVLVFATYAVKGELDRLNELVGANPFIHLAEYNAELDDANPFIPFAQFNLMPVNYQGEIKVENLDEIDPGWYYNKGNKKIIYKSYYADQIYIYSIVLDYKDVNGSGRFESTVDEFRRLHFKQLPQ